MRTLRSLCIRLASLFRRERRDEELAAELESHLQFQIEDNLCAGMTPEEARRQAIVQLGGVEQVKESYRTQRGLPWVDSLLQDVRFALRMLRKNPGFTSVAVLTLALGIGANTTLFGTYNAVALKPLPVADPGRVVRFERWFQSRALGDLQYGFSYPEFVYCRDHNTDFSALIAASWLVAAHGSTVDSPGEQTLTGQLVSANYFTDFGVRPLLGRTFASNEDQAPGGNPVIVISYPFWRRAFQQNPNAVGQVATVNGVAFTIIGVEPKEFTGTSVAPQTPDFWAPLSMQEQLVPGREWLHDPQQRVFQIYARLKPSVSRLSAQPEADVLILRFASTYTEIEKTTAVTLQRTTYFPNTDDIRFRALVAGMMLIVGLILFVACVNVGNMVFARGAVRQREISTRRALGASHGRIVRQLLAESVLLAFLGGIAGLLVSIWSTELLGAFLQRNAALIGGGFSAVDLAPDWRVMAYALGISIVAGTLLGLSPALQLAGQDLTSALKAEGGSLGKIRSSRTRNAFIAAQVAASVLLVAIAGLLTRGLVRSQAASPGFDTRDNYLLYGDFGNLGADPAKVVAAQISLVRQMHAHPELGEVTLGSIPFTGTWTPPITVGQENGRTLASYASDTYLKQLGIPLVRGRSFTTEESDTGAPVAIVSESLAHGFWPNENPMGQTFTLDMNFRGQLRTFQVIGVPKDVRFANLTRVDPAHVYLPVGLSRGIPPVGVVLSTLGDSRATIRTAESIVASAEKNPAPYLRLLSFEDGLVRQQRTFSSSLAMVAAVLAALALTLAGVGIYGVLAYLVSQRTKEIGVRIALGATPGAILKNVVIAGLRPVFAGMVAGIAVAGALSMLLHRTLLFPGSMDFLYGVPFYDPATFAGLFCFVLLIAMLASVIPAQRAMRVDPMEALRHE